MAIFGSYFGSLIWLQQNSEFFRTKEPLEGTATTDRGFFLFMSFGKNPKYGNYEVPFFEFPETILFKDCQIKNERHFIEFLLINEWVQHQVGVKMGSSNGFFPDIKGHIFNDPDTSIRVEVEYRAENYILHGHSFRGCDMILSFVRNPDTRIIKGIPVISFYEARKNDRCGILCLLDDMQYDFDNHVDEDELTPYERRLFKLGGNYLDNYRKENSIKEFERDSPAHKIAKFQKERYKANKCEFCGFENRTGSAYCSTICATQAIEARMAYLKAIPEEPYKAPPQSE